MQLLPTHGSPKFIRHRARLPESFQVLQSCSACWKNWGWATGFLLTRNLNNSLKTRGASPISFGLSPRSPFSWDFMPNTVGAVAERARCDYSPCPVAVDLDPITKRSQHQGRASLTLPPNGIAVLEEIKGAFGQAGNQKDLEFLLLFHK